MTNDKMKGKNMKMHQKNIPIRHKIPEMFPVLFLMILIFAVCGTKTAHADVTTDQFGYLEATDANGNVLTIPACFLDINGKLTMAICGTLNWDENMNYQAVTVEGRQSTAVLLSDRGGVSFFSCHTYIGGFSYEEILTKEDLNVLKESDPFELYVLTSPDLSDPSALFQDNITFQTTIISNDDIIYLKFNESIVWGETGALIVSEDKRIAGVVSNMMESEESENHLAVTALSLYEMIHEMIEPDGGGEDPVPSDTPAENPGDTPVENPGDTPTENPGDTPVENPGDTPTENPGDTPTENPGDTPTENPGDTPVQEEQLTQSPLKDPFFIYPVSLMVLLLIGGTFRYKNQQLKYAVRGENGFVIPKPSPLQENSSVHYVVGVGGIAAGTRHRLSSTAVIFGRETDCTVQYPEDPEVSRGISRHHCRLEFSQGKILLTDMNSSFGTYLMNGTKLNPQIPYELKAGDRFYLAVPANSFEIQ